MIFWSCGNELAGCVAVGNQDAVRSTCDTANVVFGSDVHVGVAVGDRAVVGDGSGTTCDTTAGVATCSLHGYGAVAHVCRVAELAENTTHLVGMVGDYVELGNRAVADFRLECGMCNHTANCGSVC